MPATVTAMAAMTATPMRRSTAIMHATAAMVFITSALVEAGTTAFGILAMAIMFSTIMAAATICTTTTAAIGAIVVNAGIGTIAVIAMAMAVVMGTDAMIDVVMVVDGVMAVDMDTMQPLVSINR